jgi:hypothetical protein
MALNAEADAGALLREPGGSVEMFCHPGTALADEQKPGSCERVTDLQFLTSSRFRDLLKAHRLRLITYWDI